MPVKFCIEFEILLLNILGKLSILTKILSISFTIWRINLPYTLVAVHKIAFLIKRKFKDDKVAWRIAR